jgi:hypothetical protein
MEQFNIPYRDEKIENAIAFFVHEYHKKTKRDLRQTFLYKFLAFFDFEIFRDTGEPALGLVYDAMDHGPVPEEIYKERRFLRTDKYISEKDGNQLIFKSMPSTHPDLDYFSPAEIAQMQRLIEIYATNYMTVSDISDASHEAILAWKRTYKKDKNGKIPYEVEFFGDVFSKSNPNTAEEHFLISHALRTAACR